MPSELGLMPSELRLVQLTAFRGFRVLDKAGSDRVVRGRASSCLKFSFPKEGYGRKGIRLKICSIAPKTKPKQWMKHNMGAVQPGVRGGLPQRPTRKRMLGNPVRVEPGGLGRKYF